MEKSQIIGLTSKQASKSLRENGYNELPKEGKRSPIAIILSVISEPMFALLLSAAGVYLLIGSLQESLILCAFALLSVGITIVQEWRSEKVLEALRDLTSPRALVVRDGIPQRIAGREVVMDDLIILSEGDRVPADARIITNDTILTDESLLSGESVAINKSAELEFPLNMIYAGALIVRGSSKAVVTATGHRSEIGKIGQALHSVETEQPRLRQQTKKIVKVFAIIAGFTSISCIILYGLLRNNWMDGLLSGIALGMALLPEEFPLILSVFMVMGAWRISKVHVLTRKVSAIEALGSATVLCTDKTGTLTQNKMSIAYLKTKNEEWQIGDKENLSQNLLTLLNDGAMASKKESYDSMDLAFFEHPLLKENIEKSIIPDFHFGLQPNLLMMAQVFHIDGQKKIFAKGAPEAIAKACHLNSEQTKAIYEDVEKLAGKGLRVLAVAEAHSDIKEIPANADQFDYHFVGLIGFADPLRDNVPTAVLQCRMAGIRVVMITGDFPVTAQSIAKQAGIESQNVLTGKEIELMDNDELHQVIKSTNIFARISPTQKLQIICALKDNGEVVAMTGDGVNDAPSLKAAHIGVAMGTRGTDVAREASSIVLLDDNFASLVHTIALGRRIYDNLRKAMVYIVAVHVPIAGLALLPLIFDKPLILTPLLIALMEMIIDPACSIVLEAEQAEKNSMERPPRDPTSLLLTSSALLWGAIQGGTAFLILGGIWMMAFQSGMPDDEVRSLVFVSLMITNLSLILVNRSFSASFVYAFKDRNPILGWGALAVISIFGFLLFTPQSKELLGLGSLHAHDVGYAVFAGIILLFILEFIKPMFRKKAFS